MRPVLVLLSGRKTPMIASAAVILAGLIAAGNVRMATAAPPQFAFEQRAKPAASLGHARAAQMQMVKVEGGIYIIGDDDGPAEQRPAHALRLAPFLIDRTEVTNDAFGEYLNALALPVRGSVGAGRVGSQNGPADVVALLTEGREGSGLYPIIALDDAQARVGLANGRFVVEEGFGDHPVTETTWAGAAAYCRWRNARLPSEAEWEAAARGKAGRRYPWGDAPADGTRAFVSGVAGRTSAVAQHPAGATPGGVHDLAGSLAEWTSSLKRPYPYAADDGREDPRAAGERVTRGGDYIYDSRPNTLTATHRNGFSNAPSRGHRHIGFRCASDITQEG